MVGHGYVPTSQSAIHRVAGYVSRESCDLDDGTADQNVIDIVKAAIGVCHR